MERMFKHNTDFIQLLFNKHLRSSSFYCPVTTFIIYLRFCSELQLLKIYTTIISLFLLQNIFHA